MRREVHRHGYFSFAALTDSIHVACSQRLNVQIIYWIECPPKMIACMFIAVYSCFCSVYSCLLLVFTYHVMKTKNRNHSINKVTNKGYDG